MSLSTAPYDIAGSPHKNAEVCAATGRTLEPGEAHVAALLERAGDTTLTRVLYASDAWARGVELPEGATLFGFWKRCVPDPGDARAHALVSDDEVMDLFEQLEDAERDGQRVFRYLLALMLLRKKRIEMVRLEPPSGDAPARLIVRRRVKGGGTDPYEVVDPRMDDDAIAEGIESLGRVVLMGDDA